MTEQISVTNYKDKNIHEDENNKSSVYLMDCYDLMKQIPDKYFDLLIADPPYVPLEENTGRIRTTGNKQSSIALGGQPDKKVFDEMFRVSKHQIIWGANNFGYPFQGFIVWEKTNIPDDFTMSRCEIASLSKELSRVSKMVRLSSASTQDHKRIHPTEKPIELYSWVFNKYAKKGWKLFDPFLGSGNSRIAADKHGLEFIGCELDETFFNAHVKMWGTYKSQFKLFF